LAAAAQLARQYDLPLCQARVLIAQGDTAAALATLETFRQQMKARGWADERLKATVLQAVALRQIGDQDQAAHALADALAQAEPGGFVRLFVNEGESMRLLISDCGLRIGEHTPRLRSYVNRLLSAFGDRPGSALELPTEIRNPPSEMIEPLSERERQVLRLMAQGLSNREIGERLFLALSTVKGHSRIIFDKLQVRNRTEAVARGRELGLV
jgi:LuxR family maltose regulon positive regulatory protein